MRSTALTRKFWLGYAEAQQYNRQMLNLLEPRWELPDTPDLRSITTQGNTKEYRLGYIVATCSPVTRAHLALAQQAANDLRLDKLFFLIWPFHYIPGFHSRPISEWVAEQKHLPWEERIDLVRRAVKDLGDDRIGVLDAVKDWYIESGSNYSESDRLSPSWTGTWYVLRKLQWAVSRIVNVKLTHHFVCGVDQFNPNITTLIDNHGGTQVWKDYSIAWHMATHNVYVVPRGITSAGALEEFRPPFGCDHDVIIGQPLPQSKFAATQVRTRTLEPGLSIDDYVMPSVAARIRDQGWWGYTHEDQLATQVK